MPNERAARDDFLAATEHIRRLMAVSDQIDDLIPCGWLSEEEAAQIRAIPKFLIRCVLDQDPLVRALRDTIDSLLSIFDDDRVATVIGDDRRIARAHEVLERTKPASDQSNLETAVVHINVLLGIIRGLDEGDECNQLILRQGEDIDDAMNFVRMHARSEPPDDPPYTVIGFTSVDELIDHLRNKQEQPDGSSDYGDEDQDWIEP